MEVPRDSLEPEEPANDEVTLEEKRQKQLPAAFVVIICLFLRFKGGVVTRSGLFGSVVRGLFWPFGIVVGAAASG